MRKWAANDQSAAFEGVAASDQVLFLLQVPNRKALCVAACGVVYCVAKTVLLPLCPPARLLSPRFPAHAD